MLYYSKLLSMQYGFIVVKLFVSLYLCATKNQFIHFFSRFNLFMTPDQLRALQNRTEDLRGYL